MIKPQHHYIQLSNMKQKYCLQSVEPFRTINQSQTNRSRTKQTYAFSRAPRFQTLQPYCPVGSYSKELPRKNSGAIIGYGKKVDFTINTALSPGTKYKLKGIFEQNKAKSKGCSMGLTRSKIAYDSYISPHVAKVPGVGRYHIQTEINVAKRRQPSFSMRKRTKLSDLTMTIEPQNENPSPAHYENNPEQSISLFSSRFKRLSFSGSRSKRFFNSDNKVPGPGDYNNPTHMSNVGRYIMSTHRGGTWAKFDSSKRVTKLDEIARASKLVPGPGSYRQSSQFGQYDGDVYRTLHSPSKRLLSQR